MGVFLNHLNDQWEEIRSIVKDDEKYRNFRQRIYAKMNENSTFWGLEPYLNMIIETFKNDQSEMDLDHLVKVYNPNK